MVPLRGQPRLVRSAWAASGASASRNNNCRGGKKVTSPLCCFCERRRSPTRAVRVHLWAQSVKTHPPKTPPPPLLPCETSWSPSGSEICPACLQRKQFTLMIHLASETIQQLVHALDASTRTTVSHVELIPLP